MNALKAVPGVVVVVVLGAQFLPIAMAEPLRPDDVAWTLPERDVNRSLTVQDIPVESKIRIRGIPPTPIVDPNVLSPDMSILEELLKKVPTSPQATGDLENATNQPSPPLAVRGSYVEGEGVTIQWEVAPDQSTLQNPAGFDIYRKLEYEHQVPWSLKTPREHPRNLPGYELIAHIEGNTTQFLDGNVTPEAVYTYIVVALGEDGQEMPGNPITVITSEYCRPVGHQEAYPFVWIQLRCIPVNLQGDAGGS